MYAEGGIAYVYLCYGIHHLFNVVANKKGIPHAILIRGIEPVEGIEVMLERMKKSKFDTTVGRGPGNVSRALGIYTRHTGCSLMGDDISIADDGIGFKSSQVISSPRIGVDYAGEDAHLLYRYYIRDNPFVSGRKIPTPIPPGTG